MGGAIKWPLSHIDSYSIGKELGRGSFGTVKLATQRRNGRKVAMKLINKHPTNRAPEKAKQRVQQEISILKSLSCHPNIISLYAVIDTPKETILVTEYASRGDLLHYILSHGRLNPVEVRDVFQQIMAGVRYCHSRNIVHRDLKLENILLDHAFKVKIADFGMSTICKPHEFLDSYCGSLYYKAPEIVRHKKHNGFLSDAWSCGVILHALLLNRFPFRGKDKESTHRKIKKASCRYLDELSPLEGKLIQGLLQVEPCKRITIQGVYRHPWITIKNPMDSNKHHGAVLSGKHKALSDVEMSQHSDFRSSWWKPASEPGKHTSDPFDMRKTESTVKTLSSIGSQCPTTYSESATT